MAEVRAAVLGVDDIIKAYKGIRGDSPYFSLWFNGTEKWMQFNEDDMEKSVDILTDNLQMIEDTGEYALYYLRVHLESRPVYTKASEVVSAIPIRLNPLPERTGLTVAGDRQPVGGGTMNYEMFEAIKSIKDLPTTLDAKFKALEDRINEIEDQEPAATDALGRITGMLENPAIVNAVAGIIGRFMPGGPPVNNPQMIARPALAGVQHQTAPEPAKDGEDDAEFTPEEQAFWMRVDNALDRLKPHCVLDVHLDKLATMAETQPDVFKFLLNQLK